MERRYPPTPYSPRSEETRLYRDAWDLGWRHYGALRSQVLAYDEGLAPGPRKRGYRDGVTARYLAEQRYKREEAQMRKRAIDDQRFSLPPEDPY